VARTAAGAALTRAPAVEQLAVRAATLRELLDLWAIVRPEDLATTIHTFVRAAIALVGVRHAESAEVAARYFWAFRGAERVAGVAPAFAPAATPPTAEVASTIRGAALAGIIDGRRAGQSIALAKDSGLVRVSGAVAKLVLTGGRRTLLTAVEADPEVLGWGRTVSGDACAFCRMLAARGPGYGSKRAADFAAHDTCACGVEPTYAGSRPSAEQRRYAEQWQAAQRQARESGDASSGTANDALNNFRRYLGG
jgi:hypothetical protein